MGENLSTYIDLNFTSAITSITTHMGDVVDMIKDEPLFLLPIGFAFMGAVIGLAKGLFAFARRRGR